MDSSLKRRDKARSRRKFKVRREVRGDASCPRFSVFKSNTNVYLQLIDDEKGVTVVSTSSLNKKREGGRKELARKLGEEIAERALKLNIAEVVFDRGRYKYHGVIAECADGARAKGLKF